MTKIPVTYTNWRGDRYTLYKRETIYGNFQYYFAKSSDRGTPCRKIPEGYEIRESANGRVSLAKIRPVQIKDEEVQIVTKILDKHPRRKAYRLGVRGKRIEIFELAGPDPDVVIGIFEQSGMSIGRRRRQRLEDVLSCQARYEAVLRFVLMDKKERTFRAERISYLSGVEDWIEIGEETGIAALANEMLQLLGTDEFFEIL